MAGVYERQKASVLRQIKAKGTIAMFARKSGQTVKNPITQAVSVAPADQKWQRYAVGLPPGRSWAFRSVNGQPTLITAEMEELHVAPEGYVPSGGDTVTWKGRLRKVIDAVVYDPDNSGPIYFRVLIG